MSAADPSPARRPQCVLVTGCAGFIGFHTARALLSRGDTVIGIDNINDYYDVVLKEARLAELNKAAHNQPGRYTFVRGDLADAATVSALFDAHPIERVIHLAAQAGVRYSLQNPHAYVASNITGFTNILEACRHHRPQHLTYASTSSVYGASTKLPFQEREGADHPLQFYAATKRANELMAHSYSHLFGLPTTGLRFFTVYGPWGRPDMALFQFVRAVLKGEPIKVFNHGNHSRDFTYVDDIVEGVVRVSDKAATPDPAWNSDAPSPSSSSAPFRIFNIGNSAPVNLGAYIEAAEKALGRQAIKEFLPLQPGDVPDTFADTSALKEWVGYKPATPVETGVARFVEWYRAFYGT
ncbi:MAG: NAD-dependent epimerase [Pseudomonadota bacterium]